MKITKKVDDYGNIFYYNENKLRHREDGPAIEYASGTKSWYLNDKRYSEQEFNNLILKKRLKRILEL